MTSNNVPTNDESSKETATQAPALAAAPSLLKELRGHLEAIERDTYEATGDNYKEGLFKILQSVDVAKGDLQMVTELVKGTLEEQAPAEPLFEAGAEQDADEAFREAVWREGLGQTGPRPDQKPEPTFDRVGDRAKRPDLLEPAVTLSKMDRGEIVDQIARIERALLSILEIDFDPTSADDLRDIAAGAGTIRRIIGIGDEEGTVSS